MKVDQYIKQIADSVDILSAQIGNARVRNLWRTDIKTRLQRLSDYGESLTGEFLSEGKRHSEEQRALNALEYMEQNHLSLEGVFDHERNDDSL